MDDVRGFLQAAVNPFVTGFQGLGIGAITDSVVNPVTDAAAQQTLQGINDLGNLSPEAQLTAATALQDSAFAVKDGINSARQWADDHPNITATAQTAITGAAVATTVWGVNKVEVNPTKWGWVKNTDDETPATRPMQTVDAEMAGGNKPQKPVNNDQVEHINSQKALPEPYKKPDTQIPPMGTFYVDSKGNVIPTPVGGYITGSKDARFVQVRDKDGNMTGARIDGAHSENTHQDPRALTGHAHVLGVTNEDGTPWLPIKK